MPRPNTILNLMTVQSSTRKSSSARKESRTDSTGNPRKDSLGVPLGPLVAYASTEGFTAEAWQTGAISWLLLSHPHQTGADAKGGAKDYIVNGKMTGGFAFIAYPEKYGDTGITTFIIDQNGIVYEKDLGKSTVETHWQSTEFNPDKTWTPVPE